MIFRAAALRSSLRRLPFNSRNLSNKPVIPASALNTWYNTFGKSTALYASWLVMLILVGEYATGKLTDALWTANNYGKTFSTVDWSKFDNFEESGEGGGDDDEDEEEDD